MHISHKHFEFKLAFYLDFTYLIEGFFSLFCSFSLKLDEIENKINEIALFRVFI